MEFLTYLKNYQPKCLSGSVVIPKALINKGNNKKLIMKIEILHYLNKCAWEFFSKTFIKHD